MQQVRSPTIVPTLYGFDMLVDPGERFIIEKAIYCSGSYEKGTIHLLDQCLRKGDTFLDVGANIGLMSLFASRKVGSEGAVYAYEPQKESYEVLARNIEINAANNIHAFPIGIGSSKMKAPLFRSTKIGRGADSFIRESPDSPKWEESVDILPLDTIVRDQKIESVRMVKIDVEGWEFEVLRGAETLLSKSDAPILSVECSLRRPNAGSPQEIFEFLKSINHYLIFKPEKNKGTISSLVEVKAITDLPRHDNIFCCTPKVAVNLPKNLFLKPLAL